MKFYERYYKNNYEELITWYPRFYRDVFEMVEILKASGQVLDALEDKIEQAYLNNFILTADTETISRWETLLGITYSEPLTLPQRKRVVIARLIGNGHIGEPEIREVIRNYTENTAMIDFGRGVISIMIEGTVFDERNLHKTILCRIPAHLALDMKIHIRRSFSGKVTVRYSGMTETRLLSDPVGEDRISAMPFSVSHGGLVESMSMALPVKEDRAARESLNMGFGGQLSVTGCGSAPDTERTAAGHMPRASGGFYHTHIKSKRIGGDGDGSI